MWSKLSPPWRAILDAAWEASCAGSVPIGAAIASQDGCVLAIGRNRLNEPRDQKLGYLSGVRLAHAEINALLALGNDATDPSDCILYTTTEPCPMCAGAIVMASIRAVRYGARDPWAGATELYRTSRYMRSKNMQVEGPTDRPDGDRLEALLFAIQVEYFLRDFDLCWNGKKTGRMMLLETMELANPPGVALGRALLHNGELDRMRKAVLPASTMFDALDGMLEEQKALP
jgi:tRNA(adenine34) deaminase